MIQRRVEYMCSCLYIGSFGVKAGYFEDRVVPSFEFGFVAQSSSVVSDPRVIGLTSHFKSYLIYLIGSVRILVGHLIEIR